MDSKVSEIAERIRAMRDDTGYSVEEIAEAVNVSPERYRILEKGDTDFTFTFLYKFAEKFGVDIVELLTGENPHLSGYALVRKGKGLYIHRREGFDYEHLAYSFKNNTADPFLVTAPYRAEELDDVPTSSHEGQEFNYVLKGKLRFVYEGHVEELGEGDSVYYDSSRRHGMTSATEEGCIFIAVVLKGEHR